MNNKTRNIVQIVLLAVVLFIFSLWAWLKPETDFSSTERRELDKLPEVSLNSILNGKFMSGFEEYTLDQFPIRDTFRTIKAFTVKYIFSHLDNNNVFVTDDGMVGKHEYPLKEDQLVLASKKFKYLYDSYFKENGGKAFVSVIPDKNAFIAEQSGHLSMDYNEFFEIMKNNTGFAEFIDIRDLLSVEDYYLTDTHWKQEMITDVADRLAEKMGVTLDKNYKINTLDREFDGVYYGQAALPVKKDTLKYLTSDIIDSCIVTNGENGQKMSMYDLEKAYGKDAYETFLSGSLSLIVIENPNADTDKEIVVFRDSFGSSLVPLLASGYKSITVVDIRYIASMVLDKYINFENKDVLFVYSTLVLNNSSMLK